MRIRPKLLLGTFAATGLAALTLATVVPATADEEGGYGERYEHERVGVVGNQLAKKECGACHMAYPRAFLPSGSWARIMDNLDNHFGENAFLPEKTRKAIRRYYTAGAPAEAAKQGPLRITETRWWRGEHHGEVRPDAFQRKEVGSPANCPACHKQAQRGMFDDD